MKTWTVVSLSVGCLAGLIASVPVPQQTNLSSKALQIFRDLARSKKDVQEYLAELEKNLPRYYRRERLSEGEEAVIVSLLNAYAPSLRLPDSDPRPKSVAEVGRQSKELQRAADFSARVMRDVAVIRAKLPKGSRALFELSGDERPVLTERSTRIVKRFREANAQPRWWTKLQPGVVRNEWVVFAPGVKDKFLVTANREFAETEGVSPKQLAFRIAANIKLAFEPEHGYTRSRAGAEATPEESRLEAMNLRLQGISEESPEVAESLLRRAIASDPKYAAAYISLADFLLEGKRDSEAQSLLKSAPVETMELADGDLIRRRLSG